jgi:hypothetical protein
MVRECGVRIENVSDFCLLDQKCAAHCARPRFSAREFVTHFPLPFASPATSEMSAPVEDLDGLRASVTKQGAAVRALKAEGAPAVRRPPLAREPRDGAMDLGLGWYGCSKLNTWHLAVLNVLSNCVLVDCRSDASRRQRDADAAAPGVRGSGVLMASAQ